MLYEVITADGFAARKRQGQAAGNGHVGTEKKHDRSSSVRIRIGADWLLQLDEGLGDLSHSGDPHVDKFRLRTGPDHDGLHPQLFGGLEIGGGILDHGAVV